jgi:hypothetical protein
MARGLPVRGGVNQGGAVILHVNYEEIRALGTGADLIRDAGQDGSGSAVAAPSAAVARAEALRARLTGDLEIATLAEQRSVREAVAAICEHLRERLETTVIEFSPGHDQAVDLYFDYAHALTVLDRVDRLGVEMTAMIEVITGSQVTEADANRITFPD